MSKLAVQLLALALSVGGVALCARPPASSLLELDGPLLPSPELVRVLLPGHTELAADFFWIQLTNAAGRAATAEEYRRIYPYAELISELAPRFKQVYQFAGALLPYNRGRDTWVNTEESTAIIKKGLAQHPGDESLKLYLLFNLMYFERDYGAAADLLKELAAAPGAPAYFGALATRLYAQASEFDAGLEMARGLAATAATEEQRRFFEHRTRQLEAERVLAEVDAAAWSYFRREGRHAVHLVELLSAGDLAAPPVDPLGGEIVLDAFGRARSTAENFRLEVYEDRSKALAQPPAQVP